MAVGKTGTRSRLTAGAVDRAPVTEPDLFQRTAAAGAGTLAPPVDLERQRMIGDRPFHRPVGAPLVDGPLQHFPDGTDQPLAFGTAEGGGGPVGTDAGAEQGLVGVDVADSGHNCPVHEELLHRDPASPAHPEEIGAVKGRGQRFRADAGQERMGCGGIRGPDHGAEFARVVETEHGAIFKDDVEMIVFAGERRPGEQPEKAGHPQMDDEPPRFTVEEQILPPPLDGADRPPRQGNMQLLRDRKPELRRPDHHPLDPLPHQLPLQPAAGQFHLGKFRHFFSPDSTCRHYTSLPVKFQESAW